MSWPCQTKLVTRCDEIKLDSINNADIFRCYSTQRYKYMEEKCHIKTLRITVTITVPCFGMSRIILEKFQIVLALLLTKVPIMRLTLAIEIAHV